MVGVGQGSRGGGAASQRRRLARLDCLLFAALVDHGVAAAAYGLVNVVVLHLSAAQMPVPNASMVRADRASRSMNADSELRSSRRSEAVKSLQDVGTRRRLIHIFFETK